MQTFVLPKPNAPSELVAPETWRWVAEYQDGVLEQFDEATGEFHPFAEIDQSRLLAFHMESPEHPHRFTIAFNPESMKLIHFYRNHIAIDLERRDSRLYCFGYEKNLNGRTEKVILAIDPEGNLIASDGSVQVVYEPLLRGGENK